MRASPVHVHLKRECVCVGGGERDGQGEGCCPHTAIKLPGDVSQASAYAGPPITERNGSPIASSIAERHQNSTTVDHSGVGYKI